MERKVVSVSQRGHEQQPFRAERILVAVITPIVASVTWQFAFSNADAFATPEWLAVRGGDSFAWSPLGVWAIGVAALVLGVIVAAIGGPVSAGVAGGALSLVVADALAERLQPIQSIAVAATGCLLAWFFAARSSARRRALVLNAFVTAIALGLALTDFWICGLHTLRTPAVEGFPEAPAMIAALVVGLVLTSTPVGWLWWRVARSANAPEPVDTPELPPIAV
jgi:hypothetical protein